MKTMRFLVPEEVTAVSRLYDLLDCLPADAEIVRIAQDFGSINVALFVRSEFFRNVPAGHIPPEAKLWFVSYGQGYRYEWRWTD